MSKSYTTSNVEGTDNLGGFVGYQSGSTINDSFWDIATTGQADSSGGTGKSTEEMYDIDTYLTAGWDFTNETENGDIDIWQMPESGYPKICLETHVGIPQFSIESGSYYVPQLLEISCSTSDASIYYTLDGSEPSSNSLLYSEPILIDSDMEVKAIGILIEESSVATAQYNINGLLSGDGNSENPFIISDLNDLRILSEYPCYWGNDFLSFKFTQSVDIDASGTIEWNNNEGFQPIGRKILGVDDIYESVPFMGDYCGDGHVISNLFIHRETGESSNFQGLFGIIKSGKVSELGVDNCIISGNSSLGGLVGLLNEGDITECYVTGNVSGEDCVGGLVGCMTNDSIIKNSYSRVNCVGNDTVAGLVGIIGNSLVKKTYSCGEVTGNSTTGGLIGISTSSTIINSLWDTECSQQEISAGGLGKLSEEMKDITTYLAESWDFIDEQENGEYDIWRIREGFYPQLSWEESPTSVMDTEKIQANFCLGNNYPNPFNPETTIYFSNDQTSLIKIDIYNLRGQKVRSLIDREYQCGNHSIVWNGCDDNNELVASGIYFCRMFVGGNSKLNKMLLMK